MPGFDPDKFLAETAPSKAAAAAPAQASKPFDPDKFLAETAPVPEPKREAMHPVESAISGIAKGLTFGYSDEIIGGARALGAKALGSDEPLGSLYDRYRDEQRAHIDQARVDNPKTFMAGDVAGSVASPVNKVLGPAKGAGFMVNAAKAGVGGSIASTGESEHNPFQSPHELGAFATDAAKGFGVGAGTSLGFSVLGSFVDALKPGAVRELASQKAVSAAGGMTKEMRELGPEGIQAVGQRLLKDKVVTAGVSLEDVAERASSQKEGAGKAIGSALKNVDDLVQTGKDLIDSGHLFPGSTPAAKTAMKGMLDDQLQFNMKRIGDRIEKELIEPNAKNPLLKGEVGKLRQIVEDFRSQGPQTLQEGNVIKGTQGKLTNFDSDTVPNAFKSEVYGVIKSELEDVVSKTGNLEQGIAKAQGQSIGSAGEAVSRNQNAAQTYEDAKKAYGAYSGVEDMAQRSLGRTAANRTIGLSDIITGTAAAATGGAVPGIAVGLGSKAVRKYGDSVAAVGLQKVADILDRSPSLLGKYAGVVGEAVKQGTLPAVNLELMKDPDYVRMLKNFDGPVYSKPDPMQLKRDAIQRRTMPLGE